MRHDDNQIEAENLAKQLGAFAYSWAPARTLAISEGILTAVFRRALDAKLIAVLPSTKEQGDRHDPK